MVEYYLEFYKELVKYEINLLPDDFNKQEAKEKIINNILTNPNHIITKFKQEEEIKEYVSNKLDSITNIIRPEISKDFPKLLKWSKRDLNFMTTRHFRIIPCDSEETCIKVYNILKTNNRYVQCGFIPNKEGKLIYFNFTKPKNKRHIDADWRYVDD